MKASADVPAPGPGSPAVTLQLTVRDLLPADLPACGWSGSPLHLRSVAGELERVRQGEVDYLAVCPPSGLPVAIGGVDYRARRTPASSGSSRSCPRFSPAASAAS